MVARVGGGPTGGLAAFVAISESPEAWGRRAHLAPALSNQCRPQLTSATN